MAEEEHLTKAERRKRRRERRQQEEQEQTRRRIRRRIINGLASLAILALVGFVVWQALSGGSGISEQVELTASEVTDARTAASCEVVDQRTEFNRDHYPSLQLAPPPGQIYEVRPPHGGRHPTQVHPVTPVAEEQLNEIALTHNLEHGSVILWYDPEKLDRAAVEAIQEWAERLDEGGFTNAQGGAGVFVSPYTDPGLPEDAAVALRAWGVAVNCGQWNRTVANAFVAQYYGTHGIAPEANSFAPYPEDTIVFEGGQPPSGFDTG